MDWLTNGVRLNSRDWDRWGVGASALCVVHCIATPIMALALPGIAATEGVMHGLLGVAIMVFASLAFIPGCRTHGKHRVILLGAIGVMLIWTALLLPQALVDDGLRDGITVVGGLVTAAAHVFNLILCRCCTGHLAACEAGIQRDGVQI
jgi:MerC mercury resistance protein